MKLRNRIIATLSAVALVVVGFAVPAAVAGSGQGGSDNPHTAAYWEAKYDNIVECYKTDGPYNTSHGVVEDNAEGAQGVKLVPFQRSWPGDRWELLIVKGGPDYNEYKLPNANQVYTPPTNPGGQSPEVSFWIVCKGYEHTPTFTPTCESLTVQFPGGANNQHINVKINPLGVDAGKDTVELNYHFEDPNLGEKVTVKWAEHPNFPNWAQWEITWIQVAGENYHWEDTLECGEPEPEPEPEKYFICVWDAKKDKAQSQEVNKIKDGDIEWVDGSECTPALITICVKDGHKDYKYKEVREGGYHDTHKRVDDSKCDTPPPVVCENLGDDPYVPSGIEIVNPGNGKDCYYDVYVCWQLQTPVDNLGHKAGWPETFPQGYVIHADNWDEVKAYCGAQPVCGDGHVQFQTDYYRINNIPKAERLETLLTNGELTHGEHGQGPDDSILLKHHTTWTFIEINADELCETEYYCVWDSEKSEASKEGVREDEEVPDDGRLWTPWTENGLDDCTPPVVQICAYGDDGWEGLDVHEDALPDEYTEWTGDARDCFGLDGEVNICHASNGDGGAFTALTINYAAEFNGHDWDFTFAGENADIDHGLDIIPPFTHEEEGELIEFPGQNWPAKFEGSEGWPAWLDYLANDCDTPVDSAVEYDSWNGVCANPNGGYTYTAEVGSFETKQRFFIKGAGGAVVLGEVASGETGTFSDNDVAPGDYTIYAEPFVVHASPRVAENSAAKDLSAQFTYAFSIDNPTGCADLLTTFLGGVCEFDAPYLRFTVVVNDPYSELEFPELGELEFLNTKNDDGNTSIALELRTDAATYLANGVDYAYSNTDTEHIWSGKVLWPGAALDSDGEPIAWPGWETNADGTYTNVGLKNYGWTRDGVDVTVTVNPAITVEDVNYPAATPICDTPPPDDGTPPPDRSTPPPEDGTIPPEQIGVSDEATPPTEFTIVAGAPPLEPAAPAVPVEATATFTG